MTYGFVTRSSVPPVVRTAVREEGGNVAAVMDQLIVHTQTRQFGMRVFARIILVLPFPRDTGRVQQPSGLDTKRTETERIIACAVGDQLVHLRSPSVDLMLRHIPVSF